MKEAGAQTTGQAAAPEQLVPGLGDIPGLKQSLLLAVDSAATLFQLFKSEAALFVHTLPTLLALDLYRIPSHLLTWISLSAVVAAGVYQWTDNPVATAGAFFGMQLLLTVIIELAVHRLRDKMSFTETRKGLATLQASFRQGLHHDST